MMRSGIRLGALLAGLAVCSQPVLAQTHEDSPLWGKPQFDRPEDIEDPEAWKEIMANLPPYPRESDLVEINLPSRGDRFTTFIDGKNLQVGEKDRVVRYTVLIRSPRGVDNVIAEGIRCGTREYRQYATGTGSAFEPTVDRPWRPIGQPSGPFAYRLALSDDWACKYDRNPYSRENILKNIAGQSNPASDFLIDDY